MAQSLPEVVEAIERARNPVRILYVTAHPDDEPGPILTYLARGMYADVALLSLTRGEGGQNALGPEYGPPLGVIRTQELLSATQAYGSRLFFTRAPDFGYSKTPEETLHIWGDAVAKDIETVIATFRPHIIINNWGGVRGGHGHHQSSGILVDQIARQFVKADPQVRCLLQLGRSSGTAGAIPLPTEEVSPLWGRSYNELGIEGFLNHRSQGIGGVRASPFFRARRSLTLVEGEFDASHLSRPLAWITRGDSRFSFRASVDASLSEAGDAAKRLDYNSAVRALVRAAKEIRGTGKDNFGFDIVIGDPITSEVLMGLQAGLGRIEHALALAAGLRVDARAMSPELVAGESFTVLVTHQLRAGVPAKVDRVSLELPEGWKVTKEETLQAGGVRFTVEIPRDAKAPNGAGDWMHPWPAPLVRAKLLLVVTKDGAVEHGVSHFEPVMAERVTSTSAEALPLELVPAVTLTPEPKRLILRASEAKQPREIVARVRHNGSRAATVRVALDVPAGWQATAPEPLAFDGPGDALVRFTVTPPAGVAPGSFKLALVARREGDASEYRASLNPLISLPTRLWSEPAVVAAHVFDLNVPAGLKVGYVAAENEPVPEALRQIGVEVTMLDEAALAFGDLSRFDALCIGIRAYELRRDLVRANKRLLDYARAGGTLVVQYHRDSSWNPQAMPPYPAQVGRGLRTTVEDSPVRILAPDHPALRTPNRITAADFDGWMQERGLYYWSRFDARYTPLLALRDPGEDETNGALVYASVGQGHYVYTGLTFFRQLPAGAPGAYRLLVNLLSLSKQ